MKKPLYLREIAHLFGDPLLEKTGLEGGNLENALQLMANFIEQLLKKQFSSQGILDEILHNIKRCCYYLSLIDADHRNQSDQSVRTIINDIHQLTGRNEWMLLPGGWKRLRKSGHAMLYLWFAKTREFVVINTGGGAQYHDHCPAGHELKLHFLRIKSVNVKQLVELVIPGLIELQLRPADYYDASLIYEVLLPMLGGEKCVVADPMKAYPSQQAGTCFWQCVDRLLFYFFQHDPSIYLAMQQAWEKATLEKVAHELAPYRTGSQALDDEALHKAPWQTYMRLLLFSIRLFSLKYLQQSSQGKPFEERHRQCFLLHELKQFAEALFEREAQSLLFYQPLPSDVWKVDARFPTFDTSTQKVPDRYSILPDTHYDQSSFIKTLQHILIYLHGINWGKPASVVNAHCLAEVFLLYLPQPKTVEWQHFLNRPFTLQETETIAGQLSELVAEYYCLQSFLHCEPTPIQYTKQVISGFNAFCFLDQLLRSLTELTFLHQYQMDLMSFYHRKTLADLSKDFLIDSPNAALQLKSQLVYLDQYSMAKKIMDFKHQEQLWYLSIDNDTRSVPDSGLLMDCLKNFDRQSYFDTLFKQESAERRFAKGIIDSDQQFIPNLIHAWRGLGLYARLLLSGFLKQDSKQHNRTSPWQLICKKTRSEETILVLNFIGLNTFPKNWLKVRSKLITDVAIGWLCDEAELVKENKLLLDKMPSSSLMPRRFFNYLGAIRTGKKLQLYGLLGLLTRQVHQLKLSEIHHLVDCYLLQAGLQIKEKGSLLFDEINQNPNVKQWLLNFMNSIDYYFSSKVKDAPVYLNLLQCFLRVERFLLFRSSDHLLCEGVFQKLYNMLIQQNQHHCQLSGHLILLYENYPMLIKNTREKDWEVIGKLVSVWPYLLRTRLLNDNFSYPLYCKSKFVLLALQEKFFFFFKENSTRNILLNQFMTNFLQDGSVQAIHWDMTSESCFHGENYFVNFFDGEIFLNRLPVACLSDAVINNADYQILFKTKVLAIKLDKSTDEVSIYKTIEKTSRFLTVFSHRYYAEAYPAIKSGLCEFKKRRYGMPYYPQLVKVSNQHLSYFPSSFSTTLDQASYQVAEYKGNDSLSENLDIIFHARLFLPSDEVWAQYIPKWRLDGLLPDILISGYHYWLVCDQSPDTDFMTFDNVVSLELAEASAKKTLLAYDSSGGVHHVMYWHECIEIFTLNAQYVPQKQWIDLLRLPTDHGMTRYYDALFAFEPANYILAWLDGDKQVTLHLVRYQLRFRWDEVQSRFLSLDYEGRHLCDKAELRFHGSSSLQYYLLLSNEYEDYTVIFPQLSRLQVGLSKDDPLNSTLYSDFRELHQPSYLSYDYAKDLQQFSTRTVLSAQYLVFLYARIRDYVKSHSYLSYCWKDQLLLQEEWQSFSRFFSETEKDRHPDQHACCLHYYLLYLPIFRLLDQRNKHQDILTTHEQQQLTQYKALFYDSIIDHYEQYLKKWLYIDERLRLNSQQEKQLLDQLTNWDEAINALNIFSIRKKLVEKSGLNLSIDVSMLSEDYTRKIRPILSDDLLTKSEYCLKEAWTLMFENKKVDIFGKFNGESITIAACFLNLYHSFLDRKITDNFIKTVALAFLVTKKKSNLLEQLLIHFLFLMGCHGADNLPGLPLNKEKFSQEFWWSFCYFSHPDYNNSDIQKLLYQWVINLITFFEKRNILVTLELTRFNNEKLNYLLDTSKLNPNTLPIDKSIDQKSSLILKNQNVDIESFKQSYDFDPNAPLAHFFRHHFSKEEQKTDCTAFPLSKAHQLQSPYSELLKNDSLGELLYEYFEKDYAKFQIQQHSHYEIRQSTSLKVLQDDLFAFQSNLNMAKTRIVNLVLQKMQFNPCQLNNINGTEVGEERGLTYYYQQLGAQAHSLNFYELLTHSFTEHTEKPCNLNPFWNKATLVTVGQKIRDYCLLEIAYQQAKKVLVILKTASSLKQDHEKISLYQQCAVVCDQSRHYPMDEAHQPYLTFEYLSGCLLWQMQVDLLEKLKKPYQETVHQLIMGGGKTSILAPLLGVLLPDRGRLMVYTVPSSLAAIFYDGLRSTLQQYFLKKIHTLRFNRLTYLNESILDAYYEKLTGILYRQEILLLTPEVPCCLLLRWVEIAQWVYQGKREFLPILERLENILIFFRGKAIQLMDELDFILAPLKSELNFTKGAAAVLDPAPLRWEFPERLLHLLLTDEHLVKIIVQGIAQNDLKAHGQHPVFQQGMLQLINPNFYEATLKPMLAKRILEVFFSDIHPIKQNKIIYFAYLINDPGIHLKQGIAIPEPLITALEETAGFQDGYNLKYDKLLSLLHNRAEIIDSRENKGYFVRHSRDYLLNVHPFIMGLVDNHVRKLYACQREIASRLVLAKEWVNVVFPHVLSKRLTLQYGPYFEMQLNPNTSERQKIYIATKKLAVPYLGKNLPSPRAEFQNLDVVIAFTLLHYAYNGLSEEEFFELLKYLQDDLENETIADIPQRNAARLFRQWQQQLGQQPVELNHLDLINETHKIKELHQLLNKNYELVCFYVNHMVFPKQLKTFNKKMTSSGFDLASMLFEVNKGFSGTVHNYPSLPANLRLTFQEGTDGSMLHILNLPENQQVITCSFNNDDEFLEKIDLYRFKFIIDSGGLIQHKNNRTVANDLIKKAPCDVEGVSYIDDTTQRIVVLTRHGLIQDIQECSIPAQHLIKYVDHAHITGTHMHQYLNDQGLMTLSTQSNLREVFQGSKRLRHLTLERHQTIVFMIRGVDVKQIRELLNLDEKMPLNSQHILKWAFSNTVKESSLELQTAIYQNFYVVIRRRAYDLLLGRVNWNILFSELKDDDKNTQIIKDLKSKGILDEFDRVRCEVTVAYLTSKLSYLNPSEAQAITRHLQKASFYRRKQESSDIVELCLSAFDETLGHQLAYLLPSTTLQKNSVQIDQFREFLINKFGSILLHEDKEELKSIAQKAKQLLPKTVKATSFQQCIQREDQEVMQLTVESHQETDQEAQRTKHHQKERQSQAQHFFKAVSRIEWPYQDILDNSIEQSIVNYSVLKRHTAQRFTVTRIKDILSLGFSDRLLATQNFLCTEEKSQPFSTICKNIIYYVEIQELNSRYFLLVDTEEAEYLKYCIDHFYLDKKPIAVRVFSGEVIAFSANFQKDHIPPYIQAQIYFLSGASDKEIPSDIVGEWEVFKQESESKALKECQENLHVALMK